MKKIIFAILFICAIFLFACNNGSNEPTPDDKPEIPDDEEVLLSSIELTQTGKTEYLVGEEFDLTGYKLQANYSNNSNKEIVLTMDMISIDLSKEGSVKGIITYKEKDITKTTDFSCVVSKVKPVKLECTVYGKTDYWSGIKLDLTGYEFKVIYNNGTEKKVDNVSCDFKTFEENETDDGIEVKIEVYTTIDGVTVSGEITVMNYSEWIYEEIEIQKQDSEVIEYVLNSVSLPTDVNKEVQIDLLSSNDLPYSNYVVTWISSNSDVIDSNGNVLPDENDKEVILTLKIRRGTKTIKEENYTILVKGLGPVVFPRFDVTKKHVFAYSYEGTFIPLTSSSASKIEFYNYCFGNIGTNHELTLAGLGHLKEVLSYRRKYGIRVILSIKNGPWAETISNDEYFKKFTDSIIRVIDEYHFDGIDMDWEFPEKNTQVPLFTKLMQGTRIALDSYKKGLFLTCALIGGGSVTNVKEYYDCPSIKDYIDFAHIMTYDLNVSSLASHHTNPLNGRAYSAEGSISFYTGAGMPAEKIVIGAAFYGKVYELTNPYSSATEDVLNKPINSSTIYTIKYSSIKSNYLNDLSYVRYYDSRCGAYYLTNGKKFITYDTPESIYTKGQLIDRYKLAGMMFWDLGSDDTFELLGAVYDVICAINTGRI